jgi:DNA-binding NarL/FixJ family response regulator
VVVLTTSDVERDITASYQLGAAGYITKPVDIDQFIDAIRQLDRYWFALVQLPKRHE